MSNKDLIRHAETLDVTKAPWGMDSYHRARFLKSAQLGIENGMCVVPLAWGTKTPLLSGWTQLATQDHNVINNWANQVCPESGCLYGGVGYVPAHGDGWARMVLDADTDVAYRFLRSVLGAPTVITAGRYSGAHKGGAHWYITTPGVIEGLDDQSAKRFGIDIFGGDGSMNRQVVAPGTYVAATNSYYHLVETPSPGEHLGTFVSNGHPLWDWMTNLAATSLAKRARPVRDENYTPREAPNLHEWMRDTEWKSLLLEDGWKPTGIDSSCGCPKWQHPWGASSDKSATAHVDGCEKSRSSAPGGSLRVWSSTVRSRYDCEYEHLSKLDYLAFLRYGGDYKAARECEGIPDEDGWGLSGCSWSPYE